MSTEPVTEAGRRLLDADLRFRSWRPLSEYPEMVVAIEREARAATLRDLRAKVVGEFEPDRWGEWDPVPVLRAAVLALIDVADAEGSEL